MLAQFTMKNVLSFKDETTIDLTSINAYKQHKYNLINGVNDNFVRFAAIYGANASGKSNLYFGLLFFSSVVVSSMNNTVDKTEDNILKRYYHPFKFTEEETPSEYQIVLVDDNNEYRYGFEFTSEKIVSEWLYRKDLSTNRQSMIIERSEADISLGASVRKECEKYKDEIPGSALMLTFFSRLSLQADIFTKVFSDINHMMFFDANHFEERRYIEKLLSGAIDENKEQLIDFLHAIDTGIIDIGYEKVPHGVAFYTCHVGEDKKIYQLNLFRESQGTLKSIVIFILASAVIRDNGVMIVDELNTKLHPLLMKFIIDLFKNEKSRAQLIYTTHDTTLLDTKFFRRDQVWFVEKNEFGYSKLTALSDFKIRSDASFEKDYLSGVYGGIPTLLDYEMEMGD